MGKDVVVTETIVIAVDPKRAMRLADECLIEIRLVESRKEPSSIWKYEYEVQGEAGKVGKFLRRLKSLEILD